MPPAGLGRISHSAAAVVWLSIAFGPQARTAASQWPSVRSTLCPSAYTPIKGDQPAGLSPMLDLVRRGPEPCELPPAHDAELHRRESRDPLADRFLY